MILVLLASSAQAADLYRIAGVVVNAATGAPLPRARAALLQEGTNRILASMTTGEDGCFRFEMPAGKYKLWGGTRDLLWFFGLRAPDMGVGSSIITGPGQNTENLVLRWYPSSSISGTITDESGEPVENVIVQLVRSTVQNGQRISNTFGWARTDDRGRYRFGRLAASTYYLAVTGRPWYASQPEPRSSDAENSEAYLPLYYPSTSDVRQAAPVVLRAGEDVRADFQVRTIPGASVTVQMEGAAADWSGTVGLLMDGIGGSDGFQTNERITLAGLTLRGIPPGHYMVRVMGTSGKTQLFGRKAIEVGATNVEVKVPVRPRPTVAGTVRFENPNMKPKGTVLARFWWEAAPNAFSTAVAADGTFSVPDVAPEPFRPMLGGTDGYFASQIAVEGAGFRDGVVEPVDGANVTVRMVASDQTGRVSGFVMDGDKPVVAVWVVLAPASLGKDWARYHGFQTDSDGSFDWAAVPAGDYYLFAAEEPRLEYRNPEALRPYLAGAQRVKVEAHGKVSLRLGVTRGK
jgi:hypothetical protein